MRHPPPLRDPADLRHCRLALARQVLAHDARCARRSTDRRPPLIWPNILRGRTMRRRALSARLPVGSAPSCPASVNGDRLSRSSMAMILPASSFPRPRQQPGTSSSSRSATGRSALARGARPATMSLAMLNTPLASRRRRLTSSADPSRSATSTMLRISWARRSWSLPASSNLVLYTLYPSATKLPLNPAMCPSCMMPARVRPSP